MTSSKDVVNRKAMILLMLLQVPLGETNLTYQRNKITEEITSD